MCLSIFVAPASMHSPRMLYPRSVTKNPLINFLNFSETCTTLSRLTI
jgi:hypothetical protein